MTFIIITWSNIQRYNDLLNQHENLQMLYNDCMEARKKLADEKVQIIGERDNAERQLITKTRDFSNLQMDLDRQQIELKKRANKMDIEKKELKEEQKKLKKLLSENWFYSLTCINKILKIFKFRWNRLSSYFEDNFHMFRIINLKIKEIK